MSLAPRPDGASHEPLTAARNAVTLGTSLLLTTTIALGVRIFIPRVLGASAFGDLRMAENIAEMLFVFLTFGVDMKLRQEAALDAAEVRQYLAGLTLLRVLGGAAAILVGAIVLASQGANLRFVLLVGVTASTQVLLVLNNSYAALEQANGDVGWLARTNFIMKLMWAMAILTVLFGWATPVRIALAAFLVEAARFLWLTLRGVRTHAISLRADLRLATAAITASFPFFVHLLAHNLYARVGTAWLGTTSGSYEVGLFSAASNVATLALIGMPLIISVLVPSAARAAAVSDEALKDLVVGSLRVALLCAIPTTLFLYLSAGPAIALLFGSGFVPAAAVLRILAPTFALAYLSTICAIVLLQQRKAWTVAGISLAGVAFTLGLHALLIPFGSRHLGDAGAAQGAAWATLLTEVGVTLLLASLTRRHWTDTKLARTGFALVIATCASMAAWMAGSRSPVSVALTSLTFAAGFVAGGGLNRENCSFMVQVWRSSHRKHGAQLSEQAT